ncbi:hypothetical protein Hamer_G000477 [Homarus americanus]|uniref:Uncharacterized protein n=1 Tax=Homarus americanus TaxID=6706 RepID=A0A8J5NB23_HOMAM|nr:hypothetical protein Hamer_G000477 [Homarus americanus]
MWALDVSLMMHTHTQTRDLVDELYRLGFGISYDTLLQLLPPSSSMSEEQRIKLAMFGDKQWKQNKI